MKKTLLPLALATATALCAGAETASFGYSDGTCDRNLTHRSGNASTQGTAIRISKEKLQALKGCRISAISASFASSYTTDKKVTLFVGTTPDTPELTQEAEISRAVKWLDFPLAEPYEIKGNEPELYIGFKGEIASGSNLLMHDGTDAATGYGYVLNGSEWTDMAGKEWGFPNVRFTIDNAPALTDLMLHPVSSNGYYKAETPYSFGGRLFNFGTEPVNSFDLTITIGNNTPVVKTYTGLSLAQGQNFDYVLDEYTSQSIGSQPITLEVGNINGKADSDPADNASESQIYFYPKNMERSILLEGFTGQECSNCPAGHKNINDYLEEHPELNIIEVMHHAGYKPDTFTMEYSGNYTFFYGTGTTFAPAMMINRTCFPSLGTVPVMWTESKYLESASSILAGTQPYVSLGLDSEFNPDTRELKVTVRSLTHNNLPYENNVLQVMLTQDKLIGSQSGASSEYVHNAVFRGAITGNAWGRLLPESVAKAGKEYTREFTYTIPEKILSDYWPNAANQPRYQIPAIPEDMKIIAFIGALGGDNVNEHPIYNAVEVRLGESHHQAGLSSTVGMEETFAAPQVDIRCVEGMITVSGEYDSVSAYSLGGCAVDTTRALSPGLYIVSVRSGNRQVTKKIIVK